MSIWETLYARQQAALAAGQESMEVTIAEVDELWAYEDAETARLNADRAKFDLPPLEGRPKTPYKVGDEGTVIGFPVKIVAKLT